MSSAALPRWRASRASRSGRPSIPRLLELVRAHRSTIVFVNSRRSAERVANRLNELGEEDIARAHHGSIAREQRLEIEDMLKSGRLPALVATSSLELGNRHGRGRPGRADRVAQVGRRRPAAGRARGAQRGGGLARPVLPQVPRRPARDAPWSTRRMRRGRDRAHTRAAPAARRAGAAARGHDGDGRVGRWRSCIALVTPRPPLPRPVAGPSSRACSTCWPAATPRTSSPSCARGSCGIAPPASSARPRRCQAAGGDQRRHHPRPRPLRRVPGRGRARGSASWTRRWCTRPAQGEVFQLGATLVADRADHPRPRARLARAGRARARCRSGRATASAGPSSWAQAVGEAARTRRVRADLDAAGGRATSRLPRRPGARPPASCPPTAPS